MQENITPEELEELELAEEWVLRMAEVEESEAEHLIEYTLRCVCNALPAVVPLRMTTETTPLYVCIAGLRQRAS
jgi:hypothetical protein